MVDYNSFAKFYDETMKLSDTSQKVESLKTWIHQYNPSAKNLLELGCGTGTILKYFSNDFKLTGLDLSQEMLTIAQQKIPEAHLHQGDMSDFNLNTKFDVILCIFDSINHLNDFSKWKSLFEKSAEHLETNGLLIFDINTIGKIKRLIDQPPLFSKIGDSYLVMDVQPTQNTLSNWNIKIFESLGEADFKLHEENIAESSFKIEDICNELTENFQIIELVSQNSNTPNDDADRVYFICRKLSN